MAHDIAEEPLGQSCLRHSKGKLGSEPNSSHPKHGAEVNTSFNRQRMRLAGEQFTNIRVFAEPPNESLQVAMVGKVFQGLEESMSLFGLLWTDVAILYCTVIARGRFEVVLDLLALKVHATSRISLGLLITGFQIQRSSFLHAGREIILLHLLLASLTSSAKPKP